MVIIFLWFVCATTLNLGMSHGKYTTSTVPCNRKDQHLLSIFKQSIQDPSNMLSSWSNEEDCCNWIGVQCNNITGRVTELHLSCPGNATKCLGGEINSSLFQLEFLTFLDLSQNNFESIHFGSTNFSNLHFLDLSYNYNLHMDNLRWLPRFSSLKYLNLNEIYLSNQTLWLQPMSMLPSLRELRLSNCFPNGINTSLGYVNFTSLVVLDMSFNNFNSEVSKWLFNFNLSSRITYLDLSFTDLRTQIPATMLNLPHLKSLILSYNDLNGSIPEWMGQFQHLEELDLSNNLLSGPIPATTGNLSSLKSLDVSHNHLNGSVPTSLGKLSKLEALMIGYNNLSGNLSDQSFTKLSNLKILVLDSSAFIFNMGSHWQPPFQLEEISMSNCKLGPEFPSWLYTQSSLNYLDISSSGLSFNAQDEFWSFATQIEYLYLSNNSISGDISTTVFNNTVVDLNSNKFTGRLPHLSPQVTSFNIANNSFSGPIYPLLCQNVTGKQKLVVLDMSHNLLSGEFPDCWMHWQSLVQVNLGSNNLRGKISDSVGSLVKLEILGVRNNFLSGKIPYSIKNCKNLWFLDLAFNEFTGNIPSWITGNMALILRSNKFNGSVPSQICQLSNLLVLDLADNRLSGPIPKCINNFTTMVTNTLNDNFLTNLALRSIIKPDLLLSVKGLNSDYWNTFEFVRIVDLSSNDLSGSIPSELFSLIAVQSLNLSHNHLVGKIASEIGQMKNLESLDLSGNQLSGEIPQSLSNLSFLNHLNLSFNNFHGRIPLGTQLQSFEASSYIGNPGLCGPPLPNKCTPEEKPNGLIKSMEVKDCDFESSFKTGMGVGFASAFWGIFGTLLFIRKWRHAYFSFLDK